MPDKDKMRGTKGGLKEYEIDNLDLKVRELHYHLAEKFPDDYVMTSGARSKVTNPGVSGSKHLSGKAIDIRPNSKVYNYLMNTTEGISKLDEAGIGVFDETDPRNMRVATGPHFHIGSDFYDVTKQRVGQFSKYGENTPTVNYFGEQHPDFDYSDFVQKRQANKKSGKHIDHSSFKNFSRDYLVENVYTNLGPSADPSKDIYTVYSNMTGKSGKDMTPDQLRKELAELPPSGGSVIGNDHSHGHGEEDYSGYHVPEEDVVNKEIVEQNQLLKRQLEMQSKVEEEKQRKLEEQAELRQLREKENEKLSFLESMIDRPAYVERNKPSTQQQSPGAYNPNPVPQQQMDLPNIWDFGSGQQFKDGGEVSTDGNEGPTVGEVLEKERSEKQIIADRLYNFGKDATHKDSLLTERITPEDARFSEYWNPEGYDGLEGQVMKEYQPSEIYINPDDSGYSFPKFNKRYTVPREDLSEGVNSLEPRVQRLSSSNMGELASGNSNPNLNIHREVNPYTNENEPMSPSQKRMLDRANYKGEGAPEFIPTPYDATSRTQLRWSNPEEASRLRTFYSKQNPELSKATSDAVSRLVSINRSNNSNNAPT